MKAVDANMTDEIEVMTATVFMDGDHQAVLLPEGLRFNGPTVAIRREGTWVVLSEKHAPEPTACGTPLPSATNSDGVER